MSRYAKIAPARVRYFRLLCENSSNPSRGGGQILQIGALRFVGAIICKHIRVRLDPPMPARLRINFRPPVAMIAESFELQASLVAGDLAPAFVAVRDRLFGGWKIFDEPCAPDRRVQH